MYENSLLSEDNMAGGCGVNCQQIQYMSTIQYSNYSVVSLSHYSSSTVVSTAIGVHVNSVVRQ